MPSADGVRIHIRVLEHFEAIAHAADDASSYPSLPREGVAYICDAIARQHRSMSADDVLALPFVKGLGTSPHLTEK